MRRRHISSISLPGSLRVHVFLCAGAWLRRQLCVFLQIKTSHRCRNNNLANLALQTYIMDLLISKSFNIYLYSLRATFTCTLPHLTSKETTAISDIGTMKYIFSSSSTLSLSSKVCIEASTRVDVIFMTRTLEFQIIGTHRHRQPPLVSLLPVSHKDRPTSVCNSLLSRTVFLTCVNSPPLPHRLLARTNQTFPRL